MGIALTDFKAKVQDVARPNRYLFTFAPPTGGGNPELLSFLCKGVQAPGKNIGEIVLNWQGMQAKIAGDPTFDDITLTFINDYEQIARKSIEDWMKFIDDQISNERTSQIDYKIDCVIDLLGRKGEVIATFKLFGVWPKTLDPLDLNMESNDTAGEFGITLGMDYWERLQK